MTLDEAKAAVYESLRQDNLDIDLHIANLKVAMAGEREVTFDADKLSQNNRAGRKMMQSYFKKRGVIVKFSA